MGGSSLSRARLSSTFGSELANHFPQHPHQTGGTQVMLDMRPFARRRSRSRSPSDSWEMKEEFRIRVLILEENVVELQRGMKEMQEDKKWWNCWWNGASGCRMPFSMCPILRGSSSGLSRHPDVKLPRWRFEDLDTAAEKQARRCMYHNH